MENKNIRWIIGIDPDVDKSGVAMLDRETRQFISITNMTFAEIVKLFAVNIPEFGYTKEDLLVVVEDSWSNGAHIYRKGEQYVSGKNARMGYDVGRCHQVGQLIIQMGEAYGVNIKAKKALRKTWSGRDNKITQEEIAYFIPCWPTRANQEERDAALLAWDEAGYPMRVKAASFNAATSRSAQGQNGMADSVRTLTKAKKMRKAMEIPADRVAKTTAEARETLKKILAKAE